MELTEEQIEAITKSLAEKLGQKPEDDPDWIKEIKRIAGEESGKTKKDVEETVRSIITELVSPMVKMNAMTPYFEGLEAEYHDVLREQLKDEYEKNPAGLMQASQHEMTRKMVQNSARWEGSQRKAATTVVTPNPSEVIDGQPQTLDKQGQELAKMFKGAGVEKTSDEIAAIVEAAF